MEQEHDEQQHEKCSMNECSGKVTHRFKLLGLDTVQFCEKHFEQYRRGKQADWFSFGLDSRHQRRCQIKDISEYMVSMIYHANAPWDGRPLPPEVLFNLPQPTIPSIYLATARYRNAHELQCLTDRCTINKSLLFLPSYIPRKPWTRRVQSLMGLPTYLIVSLPVTLAPLVYMSL